MTVQFYRFSQVPVRPMLVEAALRSERQVRGRSCRQVVKLASTIQVGPLEDRVAVAVPGADSLVFDQWQRWFWGLHLRPDRFGLFSMPGHAGTPWTRQEIEAIVADYLYMLMTELGGGTVVKAERNRALQAQTGRSHGSIEYKHQNISAVLAEFGLPFISGYKPAKNYQRALFETVDAHLSARGLHDRLATTASMGLVSPAELVFQPAPILSDEQKKIDPGIHSIIRRYDPALRDARARALGEAGEALVFEAEQNRLSSRGRDDLAAKVRWVAKEDGDGAGFDILSFTRRGEERWLEVKTTNGPATTPFWISENERRVAEKNPDVFRLTRLFDFARGPAAFCLKPPLADHVRLIPSQYRATF